jgi:hypothetical protein
MSLTSARPPAYIKVVCPYADCGHEEPMPNRTDIYVCPGCHSLVLVRPVLMARSAPERICVVPSES